MKKKKDWVEEVSEKKMAWAVFLYSYDPIGGAVRLLVSLSSVKGNLHSYQRITLNPRI